MVKSKSVIFLALLFSLLSAEKGSTGVVKDFFWALGRVPELVEELNGPWRIHQGLEGWEGEVMKSRARCLSDQKHRDSIVGAMQTNFKVAAFLALIHTRNQSRGLWGLAMNVPDPELSYVENWKLMGTKCRGAGLSREWLLLISPENLASLLGNQETWMTLLKMAPRESVAEVPSVTPALQCVVLSRRVKAHMERMDCFRRWASSTLLSATLTLQPSCRIERAQRAMEKFQDAAKAAGQDPKARLHVARGSLANMQAIEAFICSLREFVERGGLYNTQHTAMLALCFSLEQDHFGPLVEFLRPHTLQCVVKMEDDQKERRGALAAARGAREVDDPKNVRTTELGSCLPEMRRPGGPRRTSDADLENAHTIKEMEARLAQMEAQVARLRRTLALARGGEDEEP